MPAAGRSTVRVTIPDTDWPLESFTTTVIGKEPFACGLQGRLAVFDEVQPAGRPV